MFEPNRPESENRHTINVGYALIVRAVSNLTMGGIRNQILENLQAPYFSISLHTNKKLCFI